MKTYLIQTECDFCIEYKLCRYIHNQQGIPILATCQDCDTYNKESAMNNEPGYQEVLNLLEGNPFTIWVSPVSGNYMTEVCDHGFCNEAAQEAMAEVSMLNEVCCGEFPCDHWVTRLCDNHTDKNTNQKENNMKNIPNCCARTHGGRNACTNPGTYIEPVSTKGSNAWSREAKKHASEGLLGKNIPVCGIHRNQLKAGKAIAFYLEVVQEPEQLVLDVPGAIEEVLTPSEGMRLRIQGGVSCGNCRKKTGTETKHASIDAVKSCYRGNGS